MEDWNYQQDNIQNEYILLASPCRVGQEQAGRAPTVNDEKARSIANCPAQNMWQ